MYIRYISLHLVDSYGFRPMDAVGTWWYSELEVFTTHSISCFHHWEQQYPQSEEDKIHPYKMGPHQLWVGL